jgi:hypothetical protein
LCSSKRQAHEEKKTQMAPEKNPKDNPEKKKTQITFAKIQITLNKQKQKSKTQVGKRDKE